MLYKAGHVSLHGPTGAFASASPGLWNSLPSHLRDVDLSYSGFRWSLDMFVWTVGHSTVWTTLIVLSRNNLTFLLTYYELAIWSTPAVCLSFTTYMAVMCTRQCISIHTHLFTRLTALCPGLPRWAGTRKEKPIWILLEQEIVSGSGISWAICKSAPHSRQITTPAPHHSVFYRPDALPAVQPTASKHWMQKCISIHNDNIKYQSAVDAVIRQLSIKLL